MHNDTCFKCQQQGHWAKDCPNRSKPSIKGSDVPVKQCWCGGGACLVLISKTKENPGRRFYSCPGKSHGRDCGFFAWCDKGQDLGTNSWVPDLFDSLPGTSQAYHSPYVPKPYEGSPIDFTGMLDSDSPVRVPSPIEESIDSNAVEVTVPIEDLADAIRSMREEALALRTDSVCSDVTCKRLSEFVDRFVKRFRSV